ncbi:hypothetical protein KQX54_014428 [Cotesia glomerata]|uniref:Uncharacterized protein n=1 Tax=Cotesia glomerata TaxID=32391 RepID=A0AAV7IUU1_COTGL|nr:hypothetical protein KQX54_014428 [Cotesia glomerata]
MDIDSLYDYDEEEQDFYEESLLTRKIYPIDHRALKRNRGSNVSFGCGSLSTSEVMMMMAKYMKQESTSDVEDESIMPRGPERFTSMRKVPSLSDLSDPDSSIGHALSLKQHQEKKRQEQDGCFVILRIFPWLCLCIDRIRLTVEAGRNAGFYGLLYRRSRVRLLSLFDHPLVDRSNR